MRFLGLLAIGAPLAAAVWPIPSQYSSGNTTLWINSDVKVTYNTLNQVLEAPRARFPVHAADTVPQTASSNSSAGITSQQIVQNAIQRTYTTIFDQGFVPWKFHPRMSDFEPSTADKQFISAITLQQTTADPADVATPVDDTVDESYTLSVPESGEVTITAASSIGLIRGLTTFSQLFFKHSGGGAYTNLAPVEVDDAPKFAHRGLNMDVARNSFAVEDIKRTLDAMAFAKMNRFHLHITDSQSWPLVVPAIPELSAKGAYAADLVYTPEDLKDIQNYANLLGIEPILEIDMPGHTASIHFSHPELIAAFNVLPDWSTYCAEPPCGTLKLNSTAVYDFLDTLLGDVLPRVEPYSAYFHSGGDEVNLQAYLLDDTVNSNDTAVLQPLMQSFVDRNHDQIRANGLRPIVWEEMLLTWNLTLGDDVLVQTWQSDEALAQTVASGHKALAGNYNYWVSFSHSQHVWLALLTSVPVSRLRSGPMDRFCA